MKIDKLQLFAGSIVGVVLVVMVVSVFMIGSPAEQRRKQLDNIRTSELRSISNTLQSVWEEEMNLPENLNEIEDRLWQRSTLVDPGTEKQYEYVRKTSNSYELCAVFETERSDEDGRYPVKQSYVNYSQDFSEHGVGEQCFEVSFDQEKFLELNKDRGVQLIDPIPVVY